jgi:hypothetical protein
MSGASPRPSERLDGVGITDPVANFVVAMCLYAGAILNGDRPGPYAD